MHDDQRIADHGEPASQESRQPDDRDPDEDRKPQPADRKTSDKSGTTREDDAAEDGGSGAEAQSVLRRHPIAFGLGALAIVAVVVAGYVYWLFFLHPYETTDDAFVDAREFTIAPKVGGYLVAVPVTDNQHVETGDVLFQIEKRDYEIALEQSDSQVQSAKAAIKNIDAQVEAQKAQIDVAKSQVDQAQAALTFAQEDADRYKTLAQRGAGTVQQSQQSTSNLQQQQANLARANAGVTAAQQQIGSLEAQKASAQASLAQARAQRDQARLNLGYTTVTAAQPGRVVQLTGGKGEFAQAGQSLSMFVPDEKWVVANYKETQITDMRPGQPVDLEIDAYPGRKITGKVDSVQPGSGTAFSLLPAQNATGNYVKVTQRIPVKIVIDSWPGDVSIGPGMSVVPSVRVR